MLTLNRAPLCDDDTDTTLVTIRPVDWMAETLAEIEAMAWLVDNRLAAMLIGAARLALRDT